MMYQVCICPDKQCPIHGEPVPYTLTTSSTSSPVFSEATPPKENTDLKEERIKTTLAAWKEMGQWIVDGKPSIVNNVSFCIKDGNLVIEPQPGYIEKLVHQARVEELAEISLRFSRFTWGHYNPSSIFKERLKELESKEEAK